MLKSTEKGIEEVGRILPSLSDEDLETILEMFVEFQDVDYLYKESGIWKKSDFIRGDRP